MIIKETHLIELYVHIYSTHLRDSRSVLMQSTLGLNTSRLDAIPKIKSPDCSNIYPKLEREQLDSCLSKSFCTE